MNKLKIMSLVICCIIASLSSEIKCTDDSVEDIIKSLAKNTISDEPAAPSSSTSIVEEYDSEEEFRTHLFVQNSFFKRESKKENVIKKIENFETEYNSNNTITTIVLDELSSRSRIILFYNISEIARKKIEDEKFFEKTKDGYNSKKSIPYKFGDMKFFVYYNPTNAQPGNIKINGIPTYSAVFNHIMDEQIKAGAQSMANRLFITRRSKQPCKSVVASQIKILFEFEIARRIHNDGNDYHNIPIASAIERHVSINGDSRESNKDFKQIFEINGEDTTPRGYKFPFGVKNPFQGQPDRRKKAVKLIIKKDTNSSKEEVKTSYLAFFGGESESESQ